MIHYDVPVELFVDPKFEKPFSKRQFVKYSFNCDREARLIKLEIDELILYTDKNGVILPARILEKRDNEYLVLTQQGEIIISADSIIADD